MRIIKRLLLTLFLALILAAAGGSVWFFRELRTPVAHSMAGTYLEVPRGASPAETIAKLHAAGVIRRIWPIETYLKITGSGVKMKAGDYRFPSPISPLGVLKKLEEGEQRQSRFTVKEGWTRWDIAAAMAANPDFKLRDEAEALALMNDVTAIRDIDPAAQNLEGYLFPDTYNYNPGTSAAEFIAIMTRRFHHEWTQARQERARALGLSPRQSVTVASLIETEAKLAEERPLISSVIFNRLQRNIPLGIDSSIIYASKLAGKWRNNGKVYKSDVDRRSPYNTRLVTGLPPGPIASAGLSSLDAALNPAISDYIYYVRNPDRDDGAHNFYANGADFERGVQALRAWERERDARSNK